MSRNAFLCPHWHKPKLCEFYKMSKVCQNTRGPSKQWLHTQLFQRLLSGALIVFLMGKSRFSESNCDGNLISVVARAAQTDTLTWAEGVDQSVKAERASSEPVCLFNFFIELTKWASTRNIPDIIPFYHLLEALITLIKTWFDDLDRLLW